MQGVSKSKIIPSLFYWAIWARKDKLNSLKSVYSKWGATEEALSKGSPFPQNGKLQFGGNSVN
jgi:hypothetical protein